MSSIREEIRSLEKEKNILIKKMENLEIIKSGDQISEKEYDFQKNVIERKIVEIMDRLVQYRFLEG